MLTLSWKLFVCFQSGKGTVAQENINRFGMAKLRHNPRAAQENIQFGMAKTKT